MCAIGRLQLLLASTLEVIRSAAAVSRNYAGIQSTIAVAYGGREKTVDAERSVLRDQLARNRSLVETIEMITPETVVRSLDAGDLPDPDPDSCCGKAPTTIFISPT